MILSQSEEAVGHWWSSEGDIGEPRHHRGEIVAPIEAVFEFGEGAGHMLVTDGTVGASDGALDVSEGRVDPLKGGYQGAAATRSGDDRVMDAPGFADAGETVKAITDAGDGGRVIVRTQGPKLGAAAAFPPA